METTIALHQENWSTIYLYEVYANRWNEMHGQRTLQYNIIN